MRRIGQCLVVLVACGRVNYEPIAEAHDDAATIDDDAAAPNTCLREIAVGDRLVCARRTDSTVWCAGWNNLGQLGIGSLAPTRATTPTPVLDAGGGAPLVGAAQIAAASFAACVRKTDESLWCWGTNSQGRLGDGSGVDQPAPVEVLPTGSVTSVVAGGRHFCAVQPSGTVWCWGDNQGGQLGDGSMANQSTPVMVPALMDTVWVAAGRSHTCARRGDGVLACWGANAQGQLGDGTTTGRPTPVDVRWMPGGAVVSELEQVSLGRDHSCGLHVDGSVWCWGAIRTSRVRGMQTVDTVHAYGTVPVQVLPAATQIESGYGHVCALAVDRTVWCWGSSSHGQLGDGTLNDRVTPVQVVDELSAPLRDILEIAAGARSTCARRADDTIWCWGWNTEGQLANGTNDDAPRAVRTSFTCP